MGAGKSYLGKKVAKKINWDFIDFDEFIEAKTNQSIEDIFSKKGEVYFRQLESHLLEKLPLKDNTIIALGGGTPCYNNNMDWVKANGKSVYLAVDPKILFNRLVMQDQKRPLLASYEPEEWLNLIKDKLEERKKYYDLCDQTIDADVITAKQLSEKLDTF